MQMLVMLPFTMLPCTLKSQTTHWDTAHCTLARGMDMQSRVRERVQAGGLGFDAIKQECDSKQHAG